MNFARLIFCFSLVVFSGLPGLPGFATTFVNRPMSEAVKEVPNIVRGQAGDSYSDWAPDHRRLYTYTHFTVTEVLKGNLKENKILLRSPGGSKDGQEMHVPGAAQFMPSEDVVLLISARNVEDDSYDIPGFATGKYNVVKGENGEITLVNSLGGAAVYDPKKDPKTLSYNARVSLEVFRRIAKGEDIPEAAHNQFQQSNKEAPPGAYEAGHRHEEIIEKNAPKPAKTAAPAEAPTPRVEASPMSSGRWVPLSFLLLALVGGALMWWLLKSKDGE